MGDGGLAVGAALLEYFNHDQKVPTSAPKNFFIGTKPNTVDLEKKLKAHSMQYHVFKDESELVKIAAEFLKNEKVLGIMRGRMEFGPRALCHRSILASPREKNINFRKKSQFV